MVSFVAGTRARAEQLKALLREVADIDFAHPAWWIAVHGTAALEGLARAQDEDQSFYLDGSLYADTFMARRRSESRDGAEAVASAVVRARALLLALESLDGTLPGQPLRCVLEAHGHWMRRVAIGSEPPRIAFATPVGDFLAVMEDDRALAFELAEVVSGKAARTARISPLTPGAAPTAALGVVSMFAENPASAYHLHRRVWSRGGGPWLGIGLAAPYEVVTTTHLAVDGYGHALLTDRIFRNEDELPRAELVLAAAQGLGGRGLALRDQPLPVEPVLGMATASLPGAPSFAAAAYAMGRVLEPFVRGHASAEARHRARFSPTFHVPVAPGTKGDPDRRRRRVIPALLSVRMQNGAFESYEAFRQRIPGFLDREIAAEGVLSRLAQASLHAPLPTAAKRWIVAGGPPRPWLPLVEVLAGRGCLSLLRFPAGERPRDALYAASAPALHDPRIGANVLTVVESKGGTTLTLCGTGNAGSDTKAAGLLAEFQRALAQVEGVGEDVGDVVVGRRRDLEVLERG